MIEFLQTCEPHRRTARHSKLVEELAAELSNEGNDIFDPEDLLYCNSEDIQLQSAGMKSLLKAAIAFAQTKWAHTPALSSSSRTFVGFSDSWSLPKE